MALQIVCTAGGGGAKGMAERSGLGGLAMQCNICKAQFPMTQSKVQLSEHADSKHPKAAFAECFPTYVEKK